MRSALLLLCLSLALVGSGCTRKQAATSLTPAASTGASQTTAIAWLHSYEDGLKQAKQDGKPLMVDVFATWCGPCKKLDEEVFSRADIGEQGKQFVAVKVDGDLHQDVVKKLEVSGYPTTVFLTADEQELGRVRGAVSYEEMLGAMEDALSKSSQGR